MLEDEAHLTCEVVPPVHEKGPGNREQRRRVHVVAARMHDTRARRRE